jgi:hypothetical protein
LKTTLDNFILSKTDDDIKYRAVKSFNCGVQQTIWSAMPISSSPDINVEYTSAIKEKLTKKEVMQAIAN